MWRFICKIIISFRVFKKQKKKTKEKRGTQLNHYLNEFDETKIHFDYSLLLSQKTKFFFFYRKCQLYLVLKIDVRYNYPLEAREK